MWNKEYSEVLLIIAEAYLDQRQEQRAVVLLQALRILDAENPRLLPALSYALLQTEEYASALDIIDDLLRSNPCMPEHAPALLMRSKALWALGRVSEAQESWQRYLLQNGEAT